MPLKRKILSFLFTIFFTASLPALAADNTKELVPIGHTTGIKLFSDGVIVADTTQIDTPAGKRSPSADAGICKGDVILKINKNPVATNENFRETVSKNKNAPLTLTIVRDGKKQDVTVNPVCDTSGDYKIGLWIRDSMAGIGTITFYDPDRNIFGALGHGICDTDTNLLIPFGHGSVMQSKVCDIKKGESGTPGELIGEYNLNEDFGTLLSNTESGIFGKLGKSIVLTGQKPLPIASNGEIKPGSAVILSNIDGDNVEQYQINILKIYPGEQNKTKNMLIEITDKKLLDKTGGIVQGMSGSPIIQDGKLVGAVTHVLVNDPTRGYGIFIENMLEAAG